MTENKNLTKAILAVMRAVKGIDKSMTVGTGQNSYKGVSDKDVKIVIGEAMAENGLCILPIDVESKTQIDRWEETTQWKNDPPVTKMKQSVFVESKTKYLLMHDSGESMEIAGYGHGVDSQDKAAGKSLTYALKYALLYTFLVPTGHIDDADKTHSDELPTPKPKAEGRPTPPPVQYGPEIFKEIQLCMSNEALAKIWDKYPALHTDTEFKSKCAERKSQLSLAKLDLPQ